MVFSRRRLLAGAAIVCVILAAVYFHCCDPEKTRWAPQCWFYRFTGWKCPGCGTQRALYQLVHLHPGAAFRLNPLLPIALPYLGILIWLQYFGGGARHPIAYRRLFGTWGLLIALLVIAGYWIGRNVAGF